MHSQLVYIVHPFLLTPYNITDTMPDSSLIINKYIIMHISSLCYLPFVIGIDRYFNIGLNNFLLAYSFDEKYVEFSNLHIRKWQHLLVISPFFSYKGL